MDVGRTIKTLRIARRMNQSGLARKAKVSVSHISLLEQGKRDLKMSVLLRLAKAFDVSPVLFVFAASSPVDWMLIDDKLKEKLSAALLSALDER